MKFHVHTFLSSHDYSQSTSLSETPSLLAITNLLEVLLVLRYPNEHSSRVSHLNSKPVASSTAWSTVRKPCFIPSYFRGAMAWIRRTGCLFITGARERASCGSHRDEIHRCIPATSHRRRAHASDVMPAILAWFFARHTRTTHLLLPRSG